MPDVGGDLHMRVSVKGNRPLHTRTGAGSWLRPSPVRGLNSPGRSKGTLGAAGFIVGLTALICAAICLVFVFAGIGIYILKTPVVAQDAPGRLVCAGGTR